MTIFRKIIKTLVGPPSKFSIGDSVQLKGDKNLMVVIGIDWEPGMKGPLVHCQWFDAANKVSRKNLFREEDLVPFDWHSAYNH